jgi:DNA-binding NarL/FixJ family response regulator
MATEPRSGGNGSGEPTRLGVLLSVFGFPMVEAGFRAVIDAEPDLRVVGRARGPETVCEDIEATGADLVITECIPFGGSGCTTLESIETIRRLCPGTKIVALECRCNPELFSLALRAGAHGFLTREAGELDVVAAIRSVAAGHTYVSPSIVTRMVDTYVLRTSDVGVDDPYEALSDREREILRLASIGHTNRDIARALQLSEQTIHNHRASIMEKLGLHDRVELLRYSLRRGLLDPSNV